MRTTRSDMIGNQLALHHGHSRGGKCTSEYNAWRSMWKRCTDRNNPSYRRYGGRGICVCKRWEMFEEFFADVGVKPSQEHSLDRKDNDGDYEPGNTRWATVSEQQSNKRNNRIIEAFGERKTISEWSRTTNISVQALSMRIDTIGWSVERALTTHVREKKTALTSAIRSAGYKNASEFLRTHSMSPATLYEFANGTCTPTIRERLTKLLGVLE